MTEFLNTDILLALCMMAAAVLYTSVGHGGASSYIALMALFGVDTPVIRPVALVLNIIVSGLGSWRFSRAGLFRWRTLWPFLVGSLPMAFLGGSLHVPGDVYRPLVGAVLLISGARLLWPKEIAAARAWRDPPVWLAIPAGGLIGLLSGLTGTGGGIFLSPLLMFLGWSAPKPASGVAAVFILANSTAGLAGNLTLVRELPAELPMFAGAVVAGALIGTTLGIRLPQRTILKALGLVLLIAATKLLALW